MTYIYTEFKDIETDETQELELVNLNVNKTLWDKIVFICNFIIETIMAILLVLLIVIVIVTYYH